MSTEPGRRMVRLVAVSMLSASVAVSFVFTALCTGSASPPSVRAFAWSCLPWIIVSTLVVALFTGARSARDAVREGSWGARAMVVLSFLSIGFECYLFVFSGWGWPSD